ncbi:hypothetical protein AcV7_007040 [Taiwanofungus camphoratus]|nr:hypothetical protein AcV7_007040 [Antrodia cinnamomea]
MLHEWDLSKRGCQYYVASPRPELHLNYGMQSQRPFGRLRLGLRQPGTEWLCRPNLKVEARVLGRAGLAGDPLHVPSPDAPPAPPGTMFLLVAFIPKLTLFNDIVTEQHTQNQGRGLVHGIGVASDIQCSSFSMGADF